MKEMIEERYGKMALTNILSAIWFGDWDRYEKIFNEMSEDLKAEFSFHQFYHREQVKLWYDNHFFIPGDYFVSPYFSSYLADGKDEETRSQDLLCLIGIYEKTGFYFPLEKELYPDHLGCLTTFIGSALQEEINALQNDDIPYYEQLVQLEEEIRNKYIIPVLEPLLELSNKKITHKFFKQFLQFYAQAMVEEWGEAA